MNQVGQAAGPRGPLIIARVVGQIRHGDPSGWQLPDGSWLAVGGYACASSARGGSGASSAKRIAGGVTAPPLPAAVSAGSSLSSEGSSELFWRTSRLNAYRIDWFRASAPDFGEQLRESSALVIASSRGLQTR